MKAFLKALWRAILAALASSPGGGTDNGRGPSPSPEGGDAPAPPSPPPGGELVVAPGVFRSVTVSKPFAWEATVTGVERFAPEGGTNNPDAAYFAWLCEEWKDGNNAPGAYFRTYKLITADRAGRHDGKRMTVAWEASRSYILSLEVYSGKAFAEVRDSDGTLIAESGEMPFHWPRRDGELVPLTFSWGHPPSVRPGVVGARFTEVSVS